MHEAMPPLSSLRAFEAAARHLSFTQAAKELNVTAGALSHQIRGLEEFLGLRLFQRKTRSVALTEQGKSLYPGLQEGFGLIHNAVRGLRKFADDRVLVVSTSPGFTAKWLVPRLYRFAEAYPGIDLRISASISAASFANDDLDVAIRNLPLNSPRDPALTYEKLIDVGLVPVCAPKLMERMAGLDMATILAEIPLIHDDSLADCTNMPTWTNWLQAADIKGKEMDRGLRFNSADHALNAALGGAGLLLTHHILAYDDLRAGRLLAPFATKLPTERSYYFVSQKTKAAKDKIQILRHWLLQEIGSLDFS